MLLGMFCSFSSCVGLLCIHVGFYRHLELSCMVVSSLVVNYFPFGFIIVSVVDKNEEKRNVDSGRKYVIC